MFLLSFLRSAGARLRLYNIILPPSCSDSLDAHYHAGCAHMSAGTGSRLHMSATCPGAPVINARDNVGMALCTAAQRVIYIHHIPVIVCMGNSMCVEGNGVTVYSPPT